MRERILPSAVRLRDIRTTPHGHVRLAVCRSCAHESLLPVSGLLRRHSEWCLLSTAMTALTCPACGEQGHTEAQLSRVSLTG